MIQYKQGIAVVTGAAGGLGKAFATKLAERGYRLLLVDRRPGPLEQLCDALSARYGVHTDPIATDLGKREEVEQLADRLEHMGDVELLVNNAGFGAINYFLDTDPRYLVGMADVHVVAPTLLTRAVLPGMVERDHGAVINVSSLGAWVQSAGNAQYGATKCYLAVLSMSLSDELRGTNVRVQALCPGFVRTEFHAAESMKGFDLDAPAPHLWMSADDVVECSLRRLSGRQVLVFPGFKYRLLGRMAQFPLLRPLMRRFTRLPRILPTPASPAAPAPAEPGRAPVLSTVKQA